MIPKEDRWIWLENKIKTLFWDIQLIKEKLEIIEKNNDNENE
tara:strand:- start:12144 stop:12269 length:126 start_codon:yes stop_codon:yes gene_type:complete